MLNLITLLPNLKDLKIKIVMKYLLNLILALSIVSCKTDAPKDYATLSGMLNNKKSDSIIIASNSYSKTLYIAEDGSFNDTLKLDKGVYSIYDGTTSTPIFLDNGFNINVTLDGNNLNESVNFEGFGAEHSQFLVETFQLQSKLLNLDSLSTLTLPKLDTTLNDIETKMSQFYNSKTEIDSTLITDLKNELKPMLRSYNRFLAQTIKLKTALPKGTPSPSFHNYENYNGTKTSLSDLKGKYVYVDVWATWCGPCKVEIPYLKKLEKMYKDRNIEFVSLSVDDGRGYRADTPEASRSLAKNAWRKMISEKQLSGIQLIAPKGWQSEFIQNYKIDGIPRFILIDTKGNILNPDAPRPSSPQIITTLENLSV